MKTLLYLTMSILLGLFTFACGGDDDKKSDDDDDNDTAKDDDDDVVQPDDDDDDVVQPDDDDDTAKDDDDDVVQPDDDDDDDVQPDDDDDDIVDTASSATPGVPAAILSADKHGSGWKKGNCTGCHQKAHNSGYTDSQCTVCHGVNGAALRPSGHANNNCSACHSNSHKGANYKLNDCTTCHKYKLDTPEACPLTEEYDVVVIGAGGGGLGAAATLARAGKKVILLEKHYKVGGYMANFMRGDYTFEISLHAMDGLDKPDGMNVPTFTNVGIMDLIEPVKLDPMYRVIYPDFTYDIPADPDEYKQLLKTEFPDEADGVESLFAECEKVANIMRYLIRFQAGETEAINELLALYPDALDIIELYQKITLAEMLANHITDPKLVTLWTQLAGFAGAKPEDVQALFFLVMWNSYHFDGYYYFKGGSQAVSDAMAKVVTDNGGVIKLNTTATKIVVEGDMATEVRTQDDVCYKAKYVVSNANAPETLFKMIGKDKLPADYAKGAEEMKIGLSAFQVYLGVDKDYSEYFDGLHEIMLTNSYDQNEIFDAIHKCDPAKTSYAIANYTITDPETAPAGKNVIAITSQLAWECGAEWHSNDRGKYMVYKHEAAMKFIERAEADFLPDLSKHIEVLEIGTPLTMKGFTGNPKGTIFGWDNIPEQSINNRMPQQTPIKNVFLAGAWTFPGGGQSAVINSGLMAAALILQIENENP